MAAVAGIMVALSVDELMPLPKRLTLIITPAMAYYVECQCGIQFSAATNGGNWLKTTSEVSSTWTTSASFTKALFYLFGVSSLVLFKYLFRASSSASLSGETPDNNVSNAGNNPPQPEHQYNPVPGDKHPFTLNI